METREGVGRTSRVWLRTQPDLSIPLSAGEVTGGLQGAVPSSLCPQTLGAWIGKVEGLPGAHADSRPGEDSPAARVWAGGIVGRLPGPASEANWGVGTGSPQVMCSLTSRGLCVGVGLAHPKAVRPAGAGRRAGRRLQNWTQDRGGWGVEGEGRPEGRRASGPPGPAGSSSRRT